MSKKTAKQLIEDKIEEMPMEMGMPYKFVCMSTGLYFMTYGDMARYSPYTGGMDVE